VNNIYPAIPIDSTETMAQSGSRYRVVVCRNLGPDVMPLLESRHELELVIWPEDRACDRKWLLENIPGATGVIVMLTDKVDSEFLDKAGSSLRVVSTMSVGYGEIILSS
jgi:glyoxylate/hydroxypyruvate reductase